MKILCLSNDDSGGNAYFLSQAIREHTGHDARAIRMKQTYLQYPYDILGVDEAKLAVFIEWADLIHIRDGWLDLPLPRKINKPVLVTFSGNSYRRRYVWWHEECRKRGWGVSVSTLDLTLLGNAPWMPNTRPDRIDEARPDPGVFKVCHAPTFRERKGTTTIIKALTEMRGVELVLVENKPYAECHELRKTCHITIDQFRHGYGNSAIEAWALGQPVLGFDRESPKASQLAKKTFTFVPWYPTREHVRYVRRNVDRMQKDPTVFKAQQAQARRYYMNWHHPKVVAERALKLYKLVIDGHA